MALKIGRIRRARLEKPHYVSFWGRRYLCRPVFIDAILGNGEKLLAVQPLNTRPQYYLIRVDSSWSTYNYDDPCVGENIDEICDAIEDQVGPAHWTGEDSMGRERQYNDPWPAASFDSGSSWWEA